MSTLTPAPKRAGSDDDEQNDTALPESRVLHAGLSPSLWATPIAARNNASAVGEGGDADEEGISVGLTSEGGTGIVGEASAAAVAAASAASAAAVAATGGTAEAEAAGAEAAVTATSISTTTITATTLQAVLKQKIKDPESKKYEWEDRRFLLDEKRGTVSISRVDEEEILEKLDLAEVGIVSEWGGSNSERFDIALNSGNVISLKAGSTEAAQTWVLRLNGALDGGEEEGKEEEEEEEVGEDEEIGGEEEAGEEEDEEEEGGGEDEEESALGEEQAEVRVKKAAIDDEKTEEEEEEQEEEEEEEEDNGEQQQEHQEESSPSYNNLTNPSPILYVPMPSATTIKLPGDLEGREDEERETAQEIAQEKGVVEDPELVTAQILQPNDLSQSFKEAAAEEEKMRRDESFPGIGDVIKAAENGDDRDLAEALTRSELGGRTATRRKKRAVPSYMSATTASSGRGGKSKRKSRRRGATRASARGKDPARSSKRSFRRSRSSRSSRGARQAVRIPTPSIQIAMMESDVGLEIKIYKEMVGRLNGIETDTRRLDGTHVVCARSRRPRRRRCVRNERGTDPA